jgi:hypothetical protein
MQLGFEVERWKSDPKARVAMLPDLLKSTFPEIRTLTALKATLGEPDGQGVQTKTPWELSIPCPSGALANCDELIYWPNREYAQVKRPSTRIGDWLFVFDDF